MGKLEDERPATVEFGESTTVHGIGHMCKATSKAAKWAKPCHSKGGEWSYP